MINFELHTEIPMHMHKCFLPLLSLILVISCSGGAGRTDLARLVDEESWEKIIEYCMDNRDSLRFADLYLGNLALANTGQLGDKAFSIKQAGSKGLIPEWGHSVESAEWLSDIYFAMGHMAMAQRMAFEADILDPEFNPRMMKRLVQTNIVYGEFPVAEKYLDALEKHGAYTGWVKEQRRFIGHMDLVEADPFYGDLRRCIPAEDFISSVRGIDTDLKDIIRANPEHKAAMHYLGLYYLLDLDMERFGAMLDEFSGTEALDELPLCFQEAACMMSETGDHGYWKKIGVPPAEFRRYQDFKTRLGAGLDMDRFKDTFWYYMMKANGQ